MVEINGYQVQQVPYHRILTESKGEGKIVLQNRRVPAQEGQEDIAAGNPRPLDYDDLLRC